MPNDLVKRLRDTPNWMREGFHDWKDNVRTYDRAPFEAADRIEALEAQITAMEEGLTAVHMAGYMDGKKAAEAKLAKAVEALERIEDASKYYGNCPEATETTVRYAHGTTRRLARTTLAELKGGKDE